MTNNTWTNAIAILLCTSAFGAAAAAQADYAEGFENNGTVKAGQWGPQNLIDKGWIFRNQSDPANGPAWYDGNGFGGLPFDGDGYLQTDSMATDYFGGPLSVWAILPPIPGQRAADLVSIWVMGGGSPSSSTYFEVRYSPNGGAGTGSDHDDVGDFTDVLFSAELPLEAQGYRQVIESLPGDGRIAFRFWSPFIMTAFGRGTTFAIDALSVGGEPPPPCGVPIPLPGQTVTWTLADSPYTICQDLLIPTGATVIVEPGVTVTFEPDCWLHVDGALIAHGTPQQPITFDGDNQPGAGLEVGGHADLAWTRVATRFGGGGEHAVFEVRDSVISAGAFIQGVPDLAVIERCRFVGGSVAPLSGSLRIVDCDFSQGGYADVAGVLFLDNVTIDGGPLLIRGELISGTTLLDNISVTNYGAGAGVSLYGANFLLGPNLVTQGNRYPLRIELLGAGLLAGSRLPVSGNMFNYIPTNGLVLGAQRYWANTGVPYVVGNFPANYGGSLTIEPGTTVRFGPGAGAFLALTADLRAFGTPDKPITFERFDPGRSWKGLKWVDNFNARQRNVVFKGADIAAMSDGGNLLLDSCTISGNWQGTRSVTGGLVQLRNSRIMENAIGMTTTSTGRIDAQSAISPNVFAGNGLAVDYNNTTGDIPRFDHNWWNSPNGPTTDQNPGGDGDAVEGLLAGWFTPFLTAPPAQGDDPPRVEIEPIYYVAHAGEKIILRWKAKDDSSIVSQRVEFADHAYPSQYVTVAALGGGERSYEFTAPIVEPTNQYTMPSGIRVVAVDDAGQEGYDQAMVRIPYQEDFTPVYQEVQNVPDLVHPHDNVEVCWLPGGTSSVYVALDDVILAHSQGGAGSCLPIGATMPYVSTDTARFLVLSTVGAGGRLVYSYSEYFSIRPDERYGDAPPVVTLDAPLGGETFAGGGVVPVRWTASDDESVRSIGIQASYDGGTTWHSVERGLDPSLSAFDWELPASTGIDDVRIRVIATDHRFQTSSGTSAPFTILPGDPGDCPADFNGDGVVNTLDVLAFLNAFAAGDPSADFNGDTTINTLDVLAFLNAYAGGC